MLEFLFCCISQLLGDVSLCIKLKYFLATMVFRKLEEHHSKFNFEPKHVSSGLRWLLGGLHHENNKDLFHLQPVLFSGVIDPM